MNTFVDSLPALLLRSSIAIALTALAVIIVVKLVRLRSPVLHRIAWIVVLIQGCVMTRIALEVPWYTTTVSQASANEHDTLLVNSSLSDQTNRAESLATHDLSDASTEDIAFSTDATSTPANPKAPTSNPGAASTSAQQATIDRTSSSDNSTTSISLIGWLLIAWTLGMGVILLIHAVGYASLLRSLRFAKPAPKAWTQQWEQIFKQSDQPNQRRPVPMLVHSSLGPMICLTPRGYVVVVPCDLWEELTVNQRNAVLNHELAHYCRGDVWKSLIARLIALPHWFNPFAWLAVRKFDECGEWACDRFLASRDPNGANEFAKALLKIMQFPHQLGIGFRGAGSSFLTERIRRLCQSSRPQESVMKRSISVILLLLVFAFGMSEIRPVVIEQSQDEDNTAQETTATPFATGEEQLQNLASNLFVGEDDKLIAAFQSKLTTPAGKTAMLERATIMETQMREQAQQNALPDYLADYFVKQGQSLKLKDGQQAFREATIRKATEYKNDVAEVQAVIDRFRERIGEETESEKLVRRALSQPTTAWVMYAQEIRPRIRPDEMTIRELYRNFLVDNGNSQLIIRPAVRAEIQRQLDRGENRRRALPRIRDELKNWSGDIANHDELHQKLKAIFEDDFFARVCCYQTVNESGNIDQGMQNLFNYLESIFDDHGDGLRLNENGLSRMSEMVGNFEKRRELAMRLQEPLDQVVSKIPRGYDELHDRLIDAFATGLTVVQMTQSPMFQATSPGQRAEEMLTDLLGDDEAEKISLDDENAEEIVAQARNMLRTGRELRRRFASVQADVSQIADEQLREVFDSLAGKYVMLRSVQEQYSAKRFDGMGRWIQEHFDQTDDGFVLNEESRPAIQEYLRQVESIEEEMANDDF